MRPDSVCQGFSRSTLIVKAAYARPSSSMPDHSGEVITRRGCTCVSWNVIRVSSAQLREIGERDAAALLERAEAGHREPPVGDAGQREDGLGDVLGPLERRPPVGDAAVHRPVGGLASCSTSRSGIHEALLTVEPSSLGERTERRPLVGDGAVVALDDGERRHRLARHRLALAGAPVADLAARLADLAGRVVQHRAADDVAAHAEVLGGQLRERARDRPERSPSRCAPPTAAGPPG